MCTPIKSRKKMIKEKRKKERRDYERERKSRVVRRMYPLYGQHALREKKISSRSSLSICCI